MKIERIAKSLEKPLEISPLYNTFFAYLKKFSGKLIFLIKNDLNEFNCVKNILRIFNAISLKEYTWRFSTIIFLELLSFINFSLIKLIFVFLFNKVLKALRFLVL